MKPNWRIFLIAAGVVIIFGALSTYEQRRSPCASGACRLPLLPIDNTQPTATPPPTAASTNATPLQTTDESGTKS